MSAVTVDETASHPYRRHVYLVQTPYSTPWRVTAMRQVVHEGFILNLLDRKRVLSGRKLGGQEGDIQEDSEVTLGVNRYIG